MGQTCCISDNNVGRGLSQKESIDTNKTNGSNGNSKNQDIKISKPQLQLSDNRDLGQIGQIKQYEKTINKEDRNVQSFPQSSSNSNLSSSSGLDEEIRDIVMSLEKNDEYGYQLLFLRAMVKVVNKDRSEHHRSEVKMNDILKDPLKNNNLNLKEENEIIENGKQFITKEGYKILTSKKQQKGSYGMIFQVEKDKQIFVIKLQQTGFRNNLDFLDTLKFFEQEIKIFKHLKSQGCQSSVKMIDSSTPDTYPKQQAYILILESCDLDLEDYLEDENLKSYTSYERASMICELFYAVQELHRCGVLHSDIKPANILLKGEGRQRKIKICDFGFSMLKDNDGIFKPEGWKTGNIKYFGKTEDYAGPELAKNEFLDESFDCYGLGIISLQILTNNKYRKYSQKMEKELNQSTLQIFQIIKSAFSSSPKERKPLDTYIKELKQLLNNLSPPQILSQNFVFASYYNHSRNRYLNIKQQLLEDRYRRIESEPYQLY